MSGRTAHPWTDAELIAVVVAAVMLGAAEGLMTTPSRAPFVAILVMTGVLLLTATAASWWDRRRG